MNRIEVEKMYPKDQYKIICIRKRSLDNENHNQCYDLDLFFNFGGKDAYICKECFAIEEEYDNFVTILKEKGFTIHNITLADIKQKNSANFLCTPNAIFSTDDTLNSKINNIYDDNNQYRNNRQGGIHCFTTQYKIQQRHLKRNNKWNQNKQYFQPQK